MENFQEISKVVEKIDTENNIIYFNQMDRGQEWIIELPVSIDYRENFEIQNLSKENSIILSGEYMTEEAA